VLDTLANILQITRVQVLTVARLKTNASPKEKMHKKKQLNQNKVKKLHASEKEVFRGLNKISRSSKEATTAMPTVPLMASSYYQVL
jgi:uncharacterized protein YjaG (DUF416 family)